jgi:hypothetical protein
MLGRKEKKKADDTHSRELSPAMQLFGRALAASPLEVGIGLAVAVVGVVIGGVAGQVLTGLAGILISYSMTLRVAEERAQRKEEERSTDLREREIGRLRGIYRQIYNTHIQILNATSEQEHTLASFALITQSNRNLFFLLTEIEAIVGETDIRVASLANRLRSNIQEMDVLLESLPDPESVERLEQLEMEQRDLKRQLASISEGAGSPPSPAASSHAGDLQLIEKILSQIDPPDGGADEWIEFLRTCVERLAEAPEIDARLQDRSLPLTMLGHALRRRTGQQLPSLPGHKGLSGLLGKALEGTRFCVVAGGLDGTFRGVAFSDSIPADLHRSDSGFGAEAGSTPGNGPASNIGAALTPEFVKLPRPAPEWDSADWATFIREVVITSMAGQSEQSLQHIGVTFATLSDLKPPPVSGLRKFHAYMQLALADSDFCVVQKEPATEMAVARRSVAGSIGEILPDLILVEGRPRVKNPGKDSHSSDIYRRILRNALPPISLPQDALPAVIRYVEVHSIGGVEVPDLVDAISPEVSEDLRHKVKPALGLLLSCGVIGADANGILVQPPSVSGEAIVEKIEDAAAREITDRLGSVERPIIQALVGPVLSPTASPAPAA